MSGKSIGSRWILHVLGGLILGLVFVLSRPLLYSWAHDRGNRFGEWVFLIWVLSVLLHWRWIPAALPVNQLLTLLVFTGLLLLGIVGELMAFIYIGLALLFVFPVASVKCRLFLTCTSALWMPIWAWGMASVIGSSVATVSLLLAVIGFCISMYLFRFRSV